MKKNYSVMYPESSELPLELTDSVLSLKVGLGTEVREGAEVEVETGMKELAYWARRLLALAPVKLLEVKALG